MVDFDPTYPDKSAIVNATNNRCLGGHGVDGAISKAGGDGLLRDRQALPVTYPNPNPKTKKVVRCMTGNAVITGPNSYGQLRTKFVIHVVGPNCSLEKYKGSNGDTKLEKTYNASMQCAKEKGVESIAFSLLSAGVFRGNRTIHEVLNTGILAIISRWYEGLREVHLYGYSQDEFFALIEVARDLGLIREVGK